MQPRGKAEAALLAEQYLRERAAGRRPSLDVLISGSSAAADPSERATLISEIAVRVRAASVSGEGEIAANAPSPIPEIPGYCLLDEIGRGGMGVVYDAYQHSTGRRVAVKFIAEPVADSAAARRRFEREVELVSRLQHPGIVAVIDSGLHVGRYYCVMEYVEGQTLDAWFQTEAETVARRESRRDTGRLACVLEMMSRICDSVEYAHQRGVLHRDLKPSNILVDGRGQPRLLDFGLAKAVDPGSGQFMDQTLSRPGQLVGTLAYMPPEQARGAFGEISVRSDVYALGAIAYEAITGRPPCEVDGSLHEVLEGIQSVDPPRPSSLAPEATADIDAILLKALDKSPQRRYATAGEFAADLRRWLNDEPVMARPASTWRRFIKFAQRNRVLVGGMAATSAALIVGFCVSLYLYAQAARAQHVAEQRARETEQVAAFQAAMLKGIDAEQMGRGLLAGIREEAASALRRRGESDASVQEKLAELDDVLGGVNATNLAVTNLDEHILARAARTIDEQFAQQPLVRARLLQTLADSMHQLGLSEGALPLQTAALEIRRRLLSPDDPDTLVSVASLGGILLALGRLDEAEPLAREAIAGSRRVRGADDRDTLSAINLLGFLRHEAGRLEEAEPYYREALERGSRSLGDDHKDVLVWENNLGTLLHELGRIDEAERLYKHCLERQRRVLGEDHADTLRTMHNLSSLLREQKRLDESEPYGLAALQGRRRVLGDAHVSTLVTMYDRGLLLHDRAVMRDGGESARSRGELQEAADWFRRVLVGVERRFGADHPRTINIRFGLARTQLALLELDQAEEELLRIESGLRGAPRQPPGVYQRCYDLLVSLYTKREAAEPGAGHQAKADQCRQRLEEWRASTQPARGAP